MANFLKTNIPEVWNFLVYHRRHHQWVSFENTYEKTEILKNLNNANSLTARRQVTFSYQVPRNL